MKLVSFILSGQPGYGVVWDGGVGLKRNPPLFMRPGDMAEIEISGIGVLRNLVTAEAA